MKKILISILISIIIFTSFIPKSVHAATSGLYTTFIVYATRLNVYHAYIFDCGNTIPVMYIPYSEVCVEGDFCVIVEGNSVDDAYSHALDWQINYQNIANPIPNSLKSLQSWGFDGNIWSSGPFTNNTDYTTNPIGPYEPNIPEPGDDWLSDMWNWILWQLGINDDYSGDIDAYITGGDRERMEIVTPTPSPTPTTYPSPTPYSLNINYPDGTTGTITGIPSSNTTIINGGDTINNGSDFDIFAVDLKIGDGGTSNPRDGLNSIMDSSYNYLTDIDITPVSDSFSVIPNEWFLLIGVLGAIPIIAGFISKLLK